MRHRNDFIVTFDLLPFLAHCIHYYEKSQLFINLQSCKFVCLLAPQLHSMTHFPPGMKRPGDLDGR